MLKKENLFKLESVSIDSKDSGIYFLFNVNELIYVGISTNIQLRITSHKKDKQFTKSSAILGDIEDFRTQESMYIFNYLPKYNKVISEDSLYINVGSIKNVRLLSPLNFGLKLIGNIIYISREHIIEKGFEIMTKHKTAIGNKKYYELKIL